MNSSRAESLPSWKQSDIPSVRGNGIESYKNDNGVLPQPPPRVGTDEISLSTETDVEAQGLDEDGLRDVFDHPLEKLASKSSKPSTPPKPSKFTASSSTKGNASPLKERNQQTKIKTSSRILSLKNAADKIISNNRASTLRLAHGTVETNTTQTNKAYSAILGITSKTDNLCTTCKSLDLTAEKFIVKDRQSSLRNMPYSQGLSQGKSRIESPEVGPFEVGSGSGRCMLGNLRWIWENQVYCSFCRLVIKSLLDQSGTGWIDREKHPDHASIPQNKIHYLKAHCYATWQIDGRELEKGLNGILQPLARTRRIRLHWDNSDFEEAYIVLIAQPTSNNDLFFGRKVEGTAVNPKVIKRWISVCDEKHNDRCKIKPSPEFEEMIQQAYFGVVDVQDMCLTKLPQNGARYIALSYTWGDIEPFKTTLSTIRALQQPRGLDQMFQKLPRAIRDAIHLVRDLGERYFWVDSICIVQDSPESWELSRRPPFRPIDLTMLTDIRRKSYGPGLR